MEKGEVDFNNRFTSTFGFPSERAATKVKDSLTDPVRRFIEESPFLVMATSDRAGQVRRVSQGRQARLRLPRAASPASSEYWTTGTCWCPTWPATSCSNRT